jgi:hypothetical protein
MLESAAHHNLTEADTNSITDERLITEEAAGVYLGGSEKPYAEVTLRAWRREKKGPPFFRIGRSIRYSTRDLDAWLAKHRVEPRERR